MEETQLSKIFEAIKSDNLKLFSSFMLSKSDLNLCFGRFPILSLCYLYGSYKILNKYEKYMLGLSGYKVVQEFGEAYNRFKKYAGKKIRLFCDGNIVYPILMLGIIKDNETIANKYNKLYKNAEIIEKLNKIYNLSGDYKTVANEKTFSSTSNKMSFTKKIILSVISVFMCLMMILPIISIIGVGKNNGLGTEDLPILIRNEKTLLNALSSGKAYYKLANDITLSDSVKVSDFAGNIDGDNHLITFNENQDGSILEKLSGTIKNLNFKINCSDLTVSKNFAFIADISTGTIENCEISGDFNLTYNTGSETFVSLFVVQNDGTIDGVKIKSNIIASNETNFDSFLSGIAGTNNGVIKNCVLEENSFYSDTVDTAGIVCYNYGEISSCENKTSVIQTTNKQWNPYSAGVAIQNHGKIIGSINRGNIASNISSELADQEESNVNFSVYAAGIACINTNRIDSAKNYGTITAQAKTATIYAGGIVGQNTFTDTLVSVVSNSKSFSTISVSNESKDSENYVGGIAGVSVTDIVGCGFEGSIKIDVFGTCYSGGLIGISRLYISSNIKSSIIKDCYSLVEFEIVPHDDEGEEGENQTNSNVIVAGLIGCYRTSNNIVISNCHYVKKAPVEYALYFQRIIGNMIVGSGFGEDSDGYVNSYASLEELKQNASGVNFDD